MSIPGQISTFLPQTNGIPDDDVKWRKLFVGGLPWTTTTETLKKHFALFGEIEEAAVIFDKETGRSKGFGFVTMRDRKGADDSCKDPNPVIDGRKANVNLAFLGQKPRNISFSTSNTNISSLGLRQGAITPTGGAGLIQTPPHIGMHGANVQFMYPTAAQYHALALQQQLAITALQQQAIQQQALQQTNLAQSLNPQILEYLYQNSSGQNFTPTSQISPVDSLSHNSATPYSILTNNSHLLSSQLHGSNHSH